MPTEHFVTATYEVSAVSMQQAAIAIARGQSVGNPSIYSPLETKRLLKRHAAIYKINGRIIEVRFPKRNFSRTGVNYLMSVLMGGQCDIGHIKACRLVELDMRCIEGEYPKPAYGMSGIREYLQVYDRPLIGAIIKPKIGLSPKQLAEVVSQLADGGADFIKEDEILNDQKWCPMRERLPEAAKAIGDRKILYAACITGDGSEVWQKARLAAGIGATVVHINIWSGFGTYLDVRRHAKIPIFFQKSGDKVWTTGPFSIDYSVICKLVNLIGCDFAHVGMHGGYLSESEDVLKARMKALGSTVPSFSCGVTHELAPKLRNMFGNDIMITAGGAICGDPDGLTAGVMKFRKAVEG